MALLVSDAQEAAWPTGSTGEEILFTTTRIRTEPHAWFTRDKTLPKIPKSRLSR